MSQPIQFPTDAQLPLMTQLDRDTDLKTSLGSKFNDMPLNAIVDANIEPVEPTIDHDTEHDPETTIELAAIVRLVVALLAISFAAIFIRLSEFDVSANATVLGRFVTFAIVFGVIRGVNALWQRVSGRVSGRVPGRVSGLASGHISEESAESAIAAAEPITPRQWMLLIGVGVVATASMVLWAMSLTRTSVANSVLLNNLTPLFTTLGGWLILGQRFDRRFLLGLGVALTGAFALGASDLHLGHETLLGDAYALLSAVFLAAYLMCAAQLRSRFDATTILLCRCSLGTLILIPLVWLEDGNFFPETVSGWSAIIALGLLCEGLGQRLLAQSLEHFSSSFISLFLLLEPPISAMLAWIILAEQMGVANGISLLIVSIGLYIAKSSNSTTRTPSATIESTEKSS